MSQISPEDVRKVAKLAKLDVSEEDVQTFAGQLSRIVGLVEQLSAVKTDGVQPLAHAMDIHSVLRGDTLQPGLSRDAALANSPQHDDECFRVPPVM